MTVDTSHLPTIPSHVAWIISAYAALSYVGALYIFPKGRLVFSNQAVEAGNGAARARAENERWRNDPEVIKARLSGVTLSVLASCIVVYLTVKQTGDNSPLSTTFTVLGLNSPLLVPIGAWFLAPLLYTGAILAQILDQRFIFQKFWSFQSDVAPILQSWIVIRNIVLAPITEELAYRSCILAVMLLSRSSWSHMVFLSPLWFGTAHLHHGWDLYNRFGKTTPALKRAVSTVLFQLLYTTVFGWFEAFVFLRTGSVWPCMFSHGFCNLYGLPVESLNRGSPYFKVTVIALILGLVGFGFALFPWTH